MIKLLCHTITNHIYAVSYYVNVIMHKERNVHV